MFSESTVTNETYWETSNWTYSRFKIRFAFQITFSGIIALFKNVKGSLKTISFFWARHCLIRYWKTPCHEAALNISNQLSNSHENTDIQFQMTYCKLWTLVIWITLKQAKCNHFSHYNVKPSGLLMHFNMLKFSKLSNPDHKNSVRKGWILSGCSCWLRRSSRSVNQVISKQFLGDSDL